MKKSLVLLIALVVIISGTAYYAQGELLKEKDQVQITEKVLYGEKSVVDGVTVEADFAYDYKLFWNTKYEIGETPKVETEYQFYPWSQVVADFSNEGSLSLMPYGTDVNMTTYEEEKDYYGLQVAMKELYDQTPNASEGSTTVYLKDYMDQYTFMLDLELPFKAGENPPSYRDYRSYYFSKRELENDIADLEETGSNKEELERLKGYLEEIEILQAFFKIPVIDTEMYALAIVKDENGVVVGMADSHHAGGSATGEIDFPEVPEGSDAFSFNTYSAFNNGDCYFTFDAHTLEGNLVDVSQIPGGYGIYHFTYDSKMGSIDLSDLKRVYPLNIQENLTEIRVDGSGEYILVFVTDEAVHKMYVIDRKSMSLVDTFVLGNKDIYISTWTYDDYIVVATDKLTVLELGESGRYVQAFSVNRDTITERVRTLSDYPSDFLNWNTVFDWNGETLLLANRILLEMDKEHYYHDESCDFYVSAVNRRGLVYYGEYYCSLNYINDGNQNCRFNPDKENSINIRWK